MKKKTYLYCFTGQRGTQWANALKTVCPPAGGSEEYSRVQGAEHDQLMDIVLIRWWWGKRESGLSTFRLQLAWCLCACGQHEVNFSYLVGVSVSARQLEDTVLCITWGRIRTLPQSCTIVSWLLLPCLHISSLPWLVIVWTRPLELWEGHGGWMKPISYH